MDERISVVIVDDHPAWGRGLKMLLESLSTDVDVVGIASTAHEAHELVERLLPTIVLLDIHLPGPSGLEALKQIRQHFPIVKVCILTMSDRDAHVLDAMRLGASGYITKDVDPEEIDSALRKIQAGQVVVSPSLALEILENSQLETDDTLTETEIRYLRFIGEGMNNGEIAENERASEATVKRRIGNILEKLHLKSRIDAAVYAAKKGIV